MGYIKRLKDNELVGGTSETFVYPITATTAVYHDGEPLSDVITRMDVSNMPPLISNEDVTLQYGEKSTIAYINEQEITVTMPPEPEVPEPDPVNVVNYNPQLEFGQQAVIGQIEGTDLTVKMPSAPQSESVNVENKNANLQYGSTATIATIDGIDINVSLPEPPASEVSVDAIDIDVFSWGTLDDYVNWSLKERPANGYSFLYAVGLSLHYGGSGVFTRIHFRADFNVETDFEQGQLKAIDTSNCEIYGHSHTLYMYRTVNGSRVKSILSLKTSYLRIEQLRIMRHPNKTDVDTDSIGGYIKIGCSDDRTYLVFNKVEFLNFPVCSTKPAATTVASGDTGVLHPHPFTFIKIEGGSSRAGMTTGTDWSIKIEMNECQFLVHPFRFNYTTTDNPYRNAILAANYNECYAKVIYTGIIGSVQMRIYNQLAGSSKVEDTVRQTIGCSKISLIKQSDGVIAQDTTLYSDGTAKLCSVSMDIFDSTQNGLLDRAKRLRVYYGLTPEVILNIENNNASQEDEETQQNDGIPQGVIVMWSGYNENIPTGWALCDGRTVNGVQTPDLRGKFIYAAEMNRKGELGVMTDEEGWHTGEPSVSTYRTSLTITDKDLPQHIHPLTSNPAYKVPATNKGIEDIKSTGNGACAWSNNYSGNDFEMITATKVNTGCGSTSKTFSISIPKPSFYTLAFIMKVV